MNKINFDPIVLTQSLVRCASVTPLDEGAIKCVSNHLNEIGCKCEILEFSSHDSYKVKNLFATIGQGSKHLAFAGHTDVVPTGNETSWTHNPFTADITDGRIYGRGTEDMKSAIACFISATNRFIKQYGKDFGGKLSFIITGDEEHEAINGTAKIMEWAKKQGIIFHDCIVGEPTSNKKVGDKIKIGRRGSVNFYLTIKGIQGHTANPHLADNPVHHLLKILHSITLNNLDKGNENFLPSSLQVPTIDVGNSASNVIPETVKATINIRFNNLHTGDSLKNFIKEKIEETLGNNLKASYTLRQEITGESFLTNAGSLTNLVSDVCKSMNSQKPSLATDGGTSDARFIKDYCQVLEIGIINKTLHKVDENVKVEDIEKLQELYFQILKKYFNKN